MSRNVGASSGLPLRNTVYGGRPEILNPSNAKLQSQENRAGSVISPQRRAASHAQADVPLPSIEHETSSPANSNGTSISDSNVPVIRTPSTSTSPDLHSPRSQAGVNESVERALGRMNIKSPGGLENLSDLVDATDAVARGSDSRSVSLAPEGSTRGTPRRSQRSRRSTSRALRHEVRDEELPQDAFHDPSFQAAYRDAKVLMSRTQEILGSASIHNQPDSTMKRLHQEAGVLAQFAYPATRTVGFVGDSGVGKSSLLNCLLDCRGFARTSNSGEACTCVVTEYHYHGRSTFDIEVELFSLDEIKEQLSTMLSNYRYFHLNEDEIDASERSHCEELANQARDTIFSMLRGKILDESFLVQASESRVLARLNSWAAEAMPSQISRRQSGLSLEACSTNLVELSSETSSRAEPAKWPFIRKIKVSLDAHILSKGLILVDLPGLRDLNAARMAITERFLLECDEIFVICNIGRAVTDEGVQSVFELARQAQLSNVGIVCTRSDDIQADEARRDWQGNRAAHIRELQRSIAAERRRLNEMDPVIKDFAEDIEFLSEEEMAEYTGLLAESRRIQNQIIPERELELHAYLVNTRNSDVQGELQTQYRGRISANDVKVFCVSNTTYWDSREQPAEDALPALRLSGLLDLRRYCISIVAHSQRRIATTYMKDSIPALLAQLDLWVQSGAGTADAERKEAVRNALSEIRRRLERDLKSNSSQINQIRRVYRQDFRNKIYDARSISDWSDAAATAASEWAGWHHATYSAFCRNYGEYSTGAVGSHNWNEEAIEGLSSDLRGPWNDLLVIIEQRQSQIEQLLDDMIEGSGDIIADRLEEDMPEISWPLVLAFDAQKDILWSNIEEAHEEFAAGMRTLRTDAISGIQTSLIGQAMRPAYRSCNSEGGRGSDARRKAIINRMLNNEELFRDLMKDFKNNFRELAEKLQEKAQVAAANFLDSIDMTLGIILSENVALESEQDPEFRSRIGDAVRRGNGEIERIKAIIST